MSVFRLAVYPLWRYRHTGKPIQHDTQIYQTRFYILKSASYGNTLWGNSLNDPAQWEFVGTDKNKAVQTVKTGSW